jgi:hypothetical protein
VPFATGLEKLAKEPQTLPECVHAKNQLSR